MGGSVLLVRWPLYVFLIAAAIAGLVDVYRVGRKYPAGIREPLFNLVFRWPTWITLGYGLLAMSRTVVFWITCWTGALRDAPPYSPLAALCNGVLLSWVCCLLLYLYLQRNGK